MLMGEVRCEQMGAFLSILSADRGASRGGTYGKCAAMRFFLRVKTIAFNSKQRGLSHLSARAYRLQEIEPSEGQAF
jgi:hypothetical protein